LQPWPAIPFDPADNEINITETLSIPAIPSFRVAPACDLLASLQANYPHNQLFRAVRFISRRLARYEN
jgi:hypothetical protein